MAEDDPQNIPTMCGYNMLLVPLLGEGKIRETVSSDIHINDTRCDTYRFGTVLHEILHAVGGFGHPFNRADAQKYFVSPPPPPAGQGRMERFFEYDCNSIMGYP